MEPENIEFNGIEYEAKALIQFSSLVRLIFDLAKRQKELESKYEVINENISDKEQRVSDLEIKVLGESKTFQKKIDNDTNQKKIIRTILSKRKIVMITVIVIIIAI